MRKMSNGVAALDAVVDTTRCSFSALGGGVNGAKACQTSDDDDLSRRRDGRGSDRKGISPERDCLADARAACSFSMSKLFFHWWGGDAWNIIPSIYP